MPEREIKRRVHKKRKNLPNLQLYNCFFEKIEFASSCNLSNLPTPPSLAQMQFHKFSRRKLDVFQKHQTPVLKEALCVVGFLLECNYIQIISRYILGSSGTQKLGQILKRTIYIQDTVLQFEKEERGKEATKARGELKLPPRSNSAASPRSQRLLCSIIVLWISPGTHTNVYA